MDKTEAQKRIAELSGIIEYHNNLYYNQDEPEISDFEYDMLLRELENLEDENLNGAESEKAGTCDYSDSSCYTCELCPSWTIVVLNTVYTVIVCLISIICDIHFLISHIKHPFSITYTLFSIN